MHWLIKLRQGIPFITSQKKSNQLPPGAFGVKRVSVNAVKPEQQSCMAGEMAVAVRPKLNEQGLLSKVENKYHIAVR